MLKHELPPSEALYPVPVVLVSCRDKETGKPNIITLAWCGVACSKPPMLSISIRPSRYSYRLITKARDFVVNIPSAGMLKNVDMCGILSGTKTDKFAACSLTTAKPSKVSSPLIAECPVNIECVLKDVIKLGAHDMFLGEVVAVHADDGVLGHGERIDFDKAAPFVYTHGEYREVGKKIGYYGFSSK
jgi:flavin reductase (DIM6/NTAB) family NADH-FMN oxidoreductase RutF